MKRIFFVLFSLIIFSSCEKESSVVYNEQKDNFKDSTPYVPKEYVLTVLNNGRGAGEEGVYEFEVFSGEVVLFSIKLKKGQYSTVRLKENKNYRWIATQQDGYIFNPTIRTGKVYMNEDKMLSIP
ncbi:hypothetical protein CAPN001_08530 [Capnocytophaga stomatis]|uniref:hypothetical protein n=1 Tax=Capnocytophaga stomatis TaxID=1848904 RepID=UPI0019511124|nr:hypothetical protein [Capnocytophaga stomatis]GIJ93008.1 hypothetical protein CAPN002_02260 [Capnocytophaga stomatis]GIJ96284.1 hypothetical protein CAPN001_08530 [Capnocytophaga stomatis]